MINHLSSISTHYRRPSQGSNVFGGYLFLLLMAFSPLVAVADSLHNNSSLLGGRATGMGGAYRGISDDPSGCYYNPAGIALAFERSLSGSTNVLSVTDLTFRDVFDKVDWKRTSQTYNGNFVGYLNPLGGGKLGFSVVIPESELEKQDVEVTAFTVGTSLIDRYKLNRSVSDTTYLIGPSYAHEIHSKVSVGATLYLHYRSFEESQNELIFFNNKTYESNNLQKGRIEWGMRPVLGIIVSPFEKLSLGLTYAKTTILSSETKGQKFQRRFQATNVLWTDDCSGGTDDQCFEIFPVSKGKREAPGQVSLGIAYFPNSALLLSADFIYHTAVTDDEFGDKVSTSDIALGVEYYYTNSFVLRGGLYTNQANTQKVESGKTNQLSHVDLLGGTFSLSHIGRTRSLSFGMNYSAGNGTGQAIAGSETILDVDVSSYSLFMSAEFHL